MAVLLVSPEAFHHVRGTRRGRLNAFSVLVVLVVLLGYAVTYVQGFAFFPVINTFAVRETSGNKLESRIACQEGGGFLASEPTAALHAAVIQAARTAGAGAEWYAYLGASTRGNSPAHCPPALPDQIAGISAGQSFGCYWRWDQGRWSQMEDEPALPLFRKNVGVTFSIGNYFSAPASPVILSGMQNGFPSWFDRGATVVSVRRPGPMFGQDLLAVGTEDTSTWSDNEDSGGYSYAGYSFGLYYNTSRWNPSAKAASKEKFWAVCQVQGPTRDGYEMPDTSKSLENRWWVIFFVILMVVCFVLFIVTACCQENEDMDEPPEDAPEWAREETEDVTHTKSFVSTRSFVHRSNNGNAWES
ncbi:hypothetical protein JKF63_06323 [Porcisia hertigi]|uniref:Uncharacterized protein n=1 Tax=Porcisia hertigi TaxID=2761500 RepID=A0A836LIY0_9TRYP|nr:hypothetical protein JKF63_06323 [Porcisia hertigi]